MKLVSLNLENFRQHVSTEIQFESGITGIIGPNGAGKTTLLEAVAFALYSVGRSTRENMLSQHPVGRGQMRVELEFELGRHAYRVVRGLRSADLYLDGDPVPIANSTSAVTERLQRILGMSKDEFFKTYFTGQKELAAMAVMASPDRARFLSKVLGYEKLRSAQDLVSARKSTLNAELSGLREAMVDPALVSQAIADSSQRVTDATSAVRGAEHRNKIVQGAFRMITPRWTRAQHDREKVQALVADITANEREELSLQRNLERVEGELAKPIPSAKPEFQLRREVLAEMGVASAAVE